MKAISSLAMRCALIITLISGLTALSTQLRADTTGTCGGQMITIPFDDVSPANIFFCSIAKAYFSGLTGGTTPTTYSPSDPVSREQMAAFITRTLDQSLRRGHRRAALGQWWTSAGNFAQTFVLPTPVNLIKSDGANVYIAHGGGNRVMQLAASGAQGLSIPAIFTSIEKAYGIVITPNYVYATGRTTPGRVYRFIPDFNSSTSILASNLGAGPTGIAYDGKRIWTANADGDSISICSQDGVCTTVPGFDNPFGILYDGANIWVTNYGYTTGNTLVRLDSDGQVIQTVTVGQGPAFPMFDGTNIWVPNYNENTISVVRAATGVVLATLSGNGLNAPNDIAFDGQQVMVTNNGGNTLSLWKATDLTPLRSISPSPFMNPFGVCSDGQNFWVTILTSPSQGTILKF